MYFEAETYMNHPMTFGFGDMEAMAEFCLALAHVNNARDIQQEKELALANFKNQLMEASTNDSTDP